MSKLPEKFPEYSIMYKTISKQITELEKKKDKVKKEELEELELKIQRYKSELDKIKKRFPENFFD